MPLVSLRDAEPPVSLVPRIIFLNMDSLFALGANSKRQWRRGSPGDTILKTYRRGGDIPIYKCNV